MVKKPVMRWAVLLPVLALFFATPVTRASQGSGPAHLDVLYVGAHPDDEAFSLATFGRLNAEHRLRTGVVTITRGEGGGSAVGPQEGPELGMIREAEERRAVAKADIGDVLNLDKPDFFYTVSSPLTAQAWGQEDTLGKLVRVIRETRPKVVFTMDPAPTPGNHGNHQFAARLAIAAYHAAADPSSYPEQLTGEHLRTWAVSRLFTDGLRGGRNLGPACVGDFTPDEPTDRTWGVWPGRRSPGGETWAQVEKEAQREYASQGWASFPDAPKDPAQLGCEYFTQVASRVPYRVDSRDADGLLEGALLPGALPLGTTLSAEPAQYTMTPGSSVKVGVTASPGRVSLSAPAGWTVTGGGREFTVTAPADAQPGKVRLPVTLSRDNGRSGSSEALVEVVSPVVAEPALLPQLAEYQDWARAAGHPELADRVPAVQAMPVGGRRDLDITVRNRGQQAYSGTVGITPPAGFTAGADQPFQSLAPGASKTVRFSVRNTDAALPTGMRGGDHQYTVHVKPDGALAGSARGALELVPSTTVPMAAVAPQIDGVAGSGEYPGPPLNVSSRWEGTECASTQDCSATARLSWRDDTLYALVTVTDDKLGTRLDAVTDCKRHWRTDSIELTVDPRGTSENTSTTFKLAALPVTAGGPPCGVRDADNRQGAATGVRVASKVSSPYHGYSVEVAVPMSALPGAIDPAGVGLNVLVYDSDTQDKTGKTRLGWSTWGGVQGDPYRWGRASLPGYTPPADRPVAPPAPVLPLEVLASVDSPQSIDQAVRTGFPLGGAPAAKPVWLGPGFLAAGENGTAHVFTVDNTGKVLDRRVITVSPGLTPLPETTGRILVGFTNPNGGTSAAATR
ncbi:sugar-binding protein [Amycolatopsis sp. H20-H5]|uniref:sugar-binding protein n=1 Tax=Amycolatopsis sp. H20-H5 TaxID=3046309 RepID=UPI002DBEB0BE|nr:sugar-binding protein [Amycolatopsis sp. H20-H5]MEC3978990.1 sugar-binding protein [Amycolatopsis sp. H20-H5]